MINHYVNANIPKSIWFDLLPHPGQEGFAGKTVVHVIRLGKYAEDCSAFLICLPRLFNLTKRAAKLRGTDWGLKLPFGVKMPGHCPTDEKGTLKDPLLPSDRTTGSDALGYQATHERAPMHILQFCTRRWRSSNRLTDREMCGLQCRQLWWLGLLCAEANRPGQTIPAAAAYSALSDLLGWLFLPSANPGGHAWPRRRPLQESHLFLLDVCVLINDIKHNYGKKKWKTDITSSAFHWSMSLLCLSVLGDLGLLLRVLLSYPSLLT